jgi:hypothetical protein
MTCCQGRRKDAAANGLAREDPVEFEYRGLSALTAVGSATGRVYWFGCPGSRVRVHPRDALTLDKVPVLRRV